MKDIIVVGGGLTGMLTARYLHDAGADVMLIDQNELGCASSWTGNGVISSLYPWRSSPEAIELTGKSQVLYADLCAELQAETCIDPQLTTSGLLSLDSKECQLAQRWFIEQADGAEAVDSLGGSILDSHAAIRACEPALQSTENQAVLMPNVRQVRNPFLVRAVAASLRQRSVLISEHQPVSKIKSKKNQVTGVKLCGKTFKANKVVLATGTGSDAFGELKPMLKQQVLRKEEIILFRGKPGLLNHIVVQGGRYLIPRKDGRVLCGITKTVEHKDKQASGAMYADLRDFACGLVPALAELPIRNHWAGLYAGNSANIPTVGAHPDIEGLYVNTGHGDEGMATGLAAVQRLVADVQR